MSCSKEVRFPSNWAKVQWHYLRKPKDEGLIGLEELINWAGECGVADEITVRKYVEEVKPYRCFRAFCPIVPDNIVCRGLFKIYVQFFLANFIIDDVMEKDCNLDDMMKIINAFDQLDKKLSETFPKVPSIKEMQPFLQYLSDEKLGSIVIVLMDFINRCTRVLLQHGNVSDDAVFDYRQRLSIELSLYLQGGASEKQDTTQHTDIQVLRRRVFDALPIPFVQYVEVSSFSLGKQKIHIAALTELYTLAALYCVLVNDLYSYTREDNESVPSASVIKIWISKKEIANLSEAAPKIASILDEITKYAYKRVEKMKVENPNNSELHEQLDQIGYAIAGNYFLHHHASDRYKDSDVKLGMREVEEDELQEWLVDNDPYGWDVVKQFLNEHSTVAKNSNDILCGVTPRSVDSLLSLLTK